MVWMLMSMVNAIFYWYFILHRRMLYMFYRMKNAGSSSYKMERNRDTELTETGSSLTQRASKTRRETVIAKLQL